MLEKIFDYNEHARTTYVAQVATSLPSGTKVLDAGAGPCRYKPFFAHCNYSSQDFAKYTGEGHSYGEIDYVSDITSIPAEDASFDFILCTEVFEHIPRPEQALKEFSRLLKPGGKVLVTAPFAAGIHMAPYHYCGGFSPYWYKYFMPLCGLEIESIKNNGGFFKLYGQESRRFLALLTPQHPVKKALFLPLKIILAIWFRLLMPLVCYYLDPLDKSDSFTAGYFVMAHKI